MLDKRNEGAMMTPSFFIVEYSNDYQYIPEMQRLAEMDLGRCIL
jgi:hypothetical protein